MKHVRTSGKGPVQNVVLNQLPPGFLCGLPEADKKAILSVVGKPVRLVGYDDDGRAELEFRDARGVIHFIYVPVTCVSVG